MPKPPRQNELLLAELRREIDRIDEAMHGLLIERGEIIERLIAVRNPAPRSVRRARPT
jgi:chorismate mutase